MIASAMEMKTMKTMAAEMEKAEAMEIERKEMVGEVKTVASEPALR
jgi:hypothetical protein